VKHLSGGERSRLLLARILKNGGNFLILDEPTNDLDLPTLRVLEEALIAFSGVVVVVSHDRYFLNRVCTAILAFEGERRVSYSEGNYDYYLEKKKRLAPATEIKAAPAKTAAPLAARADSGKPRKLSFKELRELETIEPAILQTEENIAELEALFADPDFHRKHGQRMEEINLDLAAAKERLRTLYKRWEELDQIQAASELNRS
jgi:ABC transport system ATP-binding/permease protein